MIMMVKMMIRFFLSGGHAEGRTRMALCVL